MEALRAIDLQELVEGLAVCLVTRALPAACARPDVGAPRRVVGDDGVADRGRSLVWFSHGTSKSGRAVVTLRHPARTSPPTCRACRHDPADPAQPRITLSRATAATTPPPVVVLPVRLQRRQPPPVALLVPALAQPSCAPLRFRQAAKLTRGLPRC